jgi:hypothetical protein
LIVVECRFRPEKKKKKKKKKKKEYAGQIRKSPPTQREVQPADKKLVSKDTRAGFLKHKKGSLSAPS